MQSLETGILTLIVHTGRIQFSVCATPNPEYDQNQASKVHVNAAGVPLLFQLKIAGSHAFINTFQSP